MQRIDDIISAIRENYHGDIALKKILKKFHEESFNQGWQTNEKHHIKMSRIKKNKLERNKDEFLKKSLDYSNMVDKHKRTKK